VTRSGDFKASGWSAGGDFELQIAPMYARQGAKDVFRTVRQEFIEDAHDVFASISCDCLLSLAINERSA